VLGRMARLKGVIAFTLLFGAAAAVCLFFFTTIT
jgi:hypothetical protein